MSTQRILLSVLTAFLALSSLAQETPIDARESLALILIDHVKPAKAQQYESTLSHMMVLLKKHDASFSIRVNSTDDFRYVHRVEVGDWAGIGRVYSRWADLAKKIGEPWARLDAELMASIDHSDTSIARFRSDLSYTPDEPRVKGEEVGHIHYDFYHLAPGNSASFEKTAKSHAAQFADMKAPDGFWVYQAVIGAELPLYVVARASRGLADFHGAGAKAGAALAVDFEPLEKRVQATLRHLERTEARPRADLSYP